MRITNYTIAAFIQLDESVIKEYMLWLKFVSPIPNFKVGLFKKQIKGVNKSLTELKYKEVAKIKQHVASGDFESMLQAVELVYGIKRKQTLKMRISQFYGCIAFIINEIDKIHRMEQIHYKSEPDKHDYLLEQSGIEQLQQFADLPMIDSLAGGVIWDYDKIEEMNYLTVHIILWYRTVKENIRIRFNQLIEQKNNL